MSDFQGQFQEWCSSSYENEDGVSNFETSYTFRFNRSSSILK